MGNPLQDALGDANDALESDAGLVFSIGVTLFKAWPIEEPRSEVGKLLGSNSSANWYEARTLPTFRVGQVLTGADGLFYTVEKRGQVDPFTGTTRFAILPGRVS